MSYDQLAQHAQEIEAAAAEAEYQQKLRAANPPGVQNQHLDLPQPDRGEIERKYHNTVQPLFEPFTRMPDPSSYDTAIEDVRAAMAPLSHGKQGSSMTDPSSKQAMPANPRMHWIEDAGDSLQDWNGEAADTFKNNFLGRFGAVTTNHFLILGVLKGGLQADRAVWRRTQEDIDKVAHETMHALENLHSCGKNDWQFVLSVATAVGAIGAVPFTLGVSAVVAGVSAAAAVGGAATKATDLTGGGGTAEQVVQSMKSAIDKLTNEIRAERGRIAKAVDYYAGNVEQHQGDNSPFVTPRPDLAGMRDDKLTSRRGMGTYG